MFLDEGLTRREALMKMAGGLVTLSLAPWPQITLAEQTKTTGEPVVWNQFYQVSQTLTGRKDLSPALSARYFLALSQCFPEFHQQLAQLSDLSRQTPESQAFYDAARNAGLVAMTDHILHAWYTGTAGPSIAGDSVMVAYNDALMYNTVSDALVIPTWCAKGPLWWTELPPGVTREPSVPAIVSPIATPSAS